MKKPEDPTSPRIVRRLISSSQVKDWSQVRDFFDAMEKAPPLRDCLERGLLACGLEPSPREMTVAHQLELVRRYPALYRIAGEPPLGSNPPFAREGFAIGDGWWLIVERLSAKLATDQSLFISQVKEKYGLLTVYLDTADGRPEEYRVVMPSGKARMLSIHGQPGLSDELEAAMEEAREASRHTCELCGKPGKIGRSRRGWVSVRCPACEESER